MSDTRRDRGATLPIVALVLPVLLLMTAFAVDLGRQRSSRRTMQARADVIALDMARLADGRTLDEIIAGDATHDSAADALTASAARNDIALGQIDPVEWGTWTEASGFIATTVGTAIPNAAKVTTHETTDYFFQPGRGDVTRSAIAMNGQPATAAFSIGSFGAGIDAEEAGLLNSILSPILGNPVGVDVLAYQGLATAMLDVWDLGAELGLVSPDEVLGTEIGVDDMMLAMADVLQRSGDPGSLAMVSVLDGMAATPATQNLPPIRLGDVLSAVQGTEEAALAATLDALTLVKAAALLSQCSDPDDLSSCSGLSIPTLSTSLPLLDVSGDLQVLQAPVWVSGPVGTSGRNSQVSTDLVVEVGAQQVGTCKPTLGNLFCLLNGLLVGTIDAAVTVSATVTLADGFGEIAAIDCGSPLGLDVFTSTGLYQVDLGVSVKFGRRGVLGGLLGPLLGELNLVGSTVQTDVGQLFAFDVPPDELGVTTAEAGGGSVGLRGVALATTGGTGILGLLGTLGIDLTVGQVLTLLVNPILDVLDTQLLGPLTDLLGVNVVGADVTPQVIDCDHQTIALVG